MLPASHCKGFPHWMFWLLQVFMFIVNDKGTSWAYATPGFPQSLNPELLKELRVLAQVPDQAKLITEVGQRQSGPGRNCKCANA